MVVAYRFSAATVWIARTLRLMKAPFMSLPNLLAGHLLVPELFQEEVTAAGLGAALLGELDSPEGAARIAEFRRIHEELRCGGAGRAAEAILECAGQAA
jgi:lipid-A-disaccharide synthase